MTEAQPQTEALQRKMSLAQMLDLMRQVDEGMTELDIEEMRELIARVGLKVDGYYYAISQYEAAIERLSKEIGELAKARQAMDNRLKAIKKLLVHNIQNGNISIYTGRWTVSLRRSERVVPLRDPSAADYLAMEGCVRRSYEWDKHELKRRLTAGDPSAKEVAKLEEHFSPIFKPNKGGLQ